MVPLQLLIHISNLLAYNSDGLGPGIALSTPSLYHHTLGLLDIPYKQFLPVPGVVPIPFGFHQTLPKIPSPPQQGLEPPLNPFGRQFPIPLSLLSVPLCTRISAFGFIGGGVDLGPKFFPCLLQFLGLPPPK